MRKWPAILIALASVALLVGLAAILTQEREPHYNGRSLSSWLKTYDALVMTQDSPEFAESEAAVRQIGTNAIPHLLNWIRDEPAPWRRTVRRAIPYPVADTRLVSFLLEGSDKQGAASSGFIILGTNAASAIPALLPLIKDTTHPRTAKRAIASLSFLGPAAFPALTNSLADRSQPFRTTIAIYLGAFMAPDVGTNTVLPPLNAALNDPDPEVQRTVAYAVKRLTSDPSTDAHHQ